MKYVFLSGKPNFPNSKSFKILNLGNLGIWEISEILKKFRNCKESFGDLEIPFPMVPKYKVTFRKVYFT